MSKRIPQEMYDKIRSEYYRDFHARTLPEGYVGRWDEDMKKYLETKIEGLWDVDVQNPKDQTQNQNQNQINKETDWYDESNRN